VVGGNSVEDEVKEVFAGIRTLALGSDLTSVKCNGEWLHLGLAVDDTAGLVLTVDELSAEDADTLKDWLEPIVQAVDAQLLVTDDVDAFKTAAAELGVEHQVCKSHVKRNTEMLIDHLEAKVEADEDGSLAKMGVLPEQASRDLKRLGELIRSRQPEEEKELEEMHRRYLDAAAPGPGEKAAVAYRLWLLFLDRWNLWRYLTRYRQWMGPQGETIDGTNNGCEWAIGWWVKGRYRTMRGYRRSLRTRNGADRARSKSRSVGHCLWVNADHRRSPDINSRLVVRPMAFATAWLRVFKLQVIRLCAASRAVVVDLDIISALRQDAGHDVLICGAILTGSCQEGSLRVSQVEIIIMPGRDVGKPQLHCAVA
jgi:hypothetical protein